MTLKVREVQERCHEVDLLCGGRSAGTWGEGASMRNELVADLADERDQPHGRVPVPRVPPDEQHRVQQRLEAQRQLGELITCLSAASAHQWHWDCIKSVG